MDAFAVGRITAAGVFHFIDVRRTEVLARIAVFGDAFGVADVCVVYDQMRRLVLFMFGAGVVEICQLVKRKFAIALGFADELCARSAIGGKLIKMLHGLVAFVRWINFVLAASAGHLLDSSVDEPGDQAF